MTYFLCMTGETTGLGPDARLLEFGWLLFNPFTGDDAAGGVYLFLPPEGVEIEDGALAVHEKSGLLDDLAGEEIETPAAALKEIQTALKTCNDPVHIMLYWGGLKAALTNDGIWDKLKRGAPLDFHTANQFRSTFTGNPPVHPAQSRALDKLACMRKAIVEWKTLFKLATVRA